MALIQATRQYFALHNLQVITCVAWSPDDIDGRNYPYKAMADASDYLYVMDYDTRSQIFDLCLVSVNAPIAGMIHGIQRYLELDILPRKLISGVPWHGYRYPCLPGTTLQSNFCPIPQVPATQRLSGLLLTFLIIIVVSYVIRFSWRGLSG